MYVLWSEFVEPYWDWVESAGSVQLVKTHHPGAPRGAVSRGRARATPDRVCAAYSSFTVSSSASLFLAELPGAFSLVCYHEGNLVSISSLLLLVY